MPESMSLQNDEQFHVKNWMTPSPFCIQPGQTLAEASKDGESSPGKPACTG